MIQVEVLIDKQGAMTVEINGVQGPGCERFSEAIKAAVAADFEEDNKDEFYELDVTEEVQF